MKLQPVPLDVAVQTARSTTLLHILYKTRGGGGNWNGKRAGGSYHTASCVKHRISIPRQHKDEHLIKGGRVYQMIFNHYRP
jgi:hypothetical protein